MLCCHPSPASSYPYSIRIYQGLFLLYNFYPRTQPCTDKIPGSSRLYTGHNQCFECSFFRLVLCENVNSDCGTFHALTSFQKSITLLVPNKPLFFTFSFFVHSATIPKKKSDLPAAESRAVKILAENVKENDKTDEIHEQWLLAANVLNRFFIWLFLIAVIITIIAVFTEDTTRLETQISLNPG